MGAVCGASAGCWSTKLSLKRKGILPGKDAFSCALCAIRMLFPADDVGDRFKLAWYFASF
jgi:hypothetical protein